MFLVLLLKENHCGNCGGLDPPSLRLSTQTLNKLDNCTCPSNRPSLLAYPPSDATTTDEQRPRKHRQPTSRHHEDEK